MSRLPGLGVMISVVAAILTILQFIVWVSIGHSPSGPEFVVLITVPIVSLLILVWFLTRAFGQQLARLFRANNDLEEQSREGERARLLSQHIADIAHGLAVEVNADESVSVDRLARLLKDKSKELAAAFTEALGTRCRVCVKQVCEESSTLRLYVKTICRDHGSAADKSGITHYVDQNTDFDALRSEEHDYWFCRDIVALPKYSNTAPERHYRSVIVWPITSRAQIGVNYAQPIVAFLCLDSEKVGAFDETRHVSAVWCVADAMAKAYEASYLTFTESEGLGSNPLESD